MAGALEHGALAAASEMDTETFTIEKKRACDATLDDLLQARGHLFCAPEKLASTSGDARVLPQDLLGGEVQGAMIVSRSVWKSGRARRRRSASS